MFYAVQGRMIGRVKLAKGLQVGRCAPADSVVAPQLCRDALNPQRRKLEDTIAGWCRHRAQELLIIRLTA